jgi:hypothetical protein
MIVLAIAVLAFMILCLGYWIGQKETENKYCTVYNYVDIDDNSGYALDCWGDKGGLICKAEDGVIIQVKQYTPINRCEKHN